MGRINPLWKRQEYWRELNPILLERVQKGLPVTDNIDDILDRSIQDFYTMPPWDNVWPEFAASDSTCGYTYVFMSEYECIRDLHELAITRKLISIKGVGKMRANNIVHRLEMLTAMKYPHY